VLRWLCIGSKLVGFEIVVFDPIGVTLDLASLPRLPHLRALSIDASGSYDLPVSGAGHLRDLPELAQLHVRGRSMFPMGELRGLSQLKILEIGVAYDRSRDVAQLQCWSRLKRLVIHGSAVSAAAVAAFHQNRPDCRVEYP
jgi:hypothetical protein